MRESASIQISNVRARAFIYTLLHPIYTHTYKHGASQRNALVISGDNERVSLSIALL